VLAARASKDEIILVGQEAALKAEIAKYDTRKLALTIHNASEIIGMDESPAQAVRQKRDSSMFVRRRSRQTGKQTLSFPRAIPAPRWPQRS